MSNRICKLQFTYGGSIRVLPFRKSSDGYIEVDETLSVFGIINGEPSIVEGDAFTVLMSAQVLKYGLLCYDYGNGVATTFAIFNGDNTLLAYQDILLSSEIVVYVPNPEMNVRNTWILNYEITPGPDTSGPLLYDKYSGYGIIPMFSYDESDLYVGLTLVQNFELVAWQIDDIILNCPNRIIIPSYDKTNRTTENFFIYPQNETVDIEHFTEIILGELEDVKTKVSSVSNMFVAM